MATKNGKSLATALQGFIDREVDRALRRLKIPSRAAFAREFEFYESRWTKDGGYDEISDPIVARIQALELLDAIITTESTDLDGTDAWLTELQDIIRVALKRTLTPRERSEVFAKVDAARRPAAEKAAIRKAIYKREQDERDFAAALAGEDRFFWAVDGLDRAAAGAAAA